MKTSEFLRFCAPNPPPPKFSGSVTDHVTGCSAHADMVASDLVTCSSGHNIILSQSEGLGKTVLGSVPYKREKVQNINGIFALIFHKCETAFITALLLFFFFCGDSMAGTAQRSLFFTNVESSRFAVRCLFFWDNLFLWDQRCEKAASQSLSYGIFAKTSGHVYIFSGAYAEGKS